MNTKHISFLIFISWLTSLSFLQPQSMHNSYFTIPDISMLDIEPNTSDIVLEFDVPTNPGDKIIPLSGDTKWLNYTATLALGGTPKNITAQMSTINSVPGLNLDINISNYTGNGIGALGTSAGTITLSSTAQTIIFGIGGCFTRNGANMGHEIEYIASIYDYSIFEVPSNLSIDVIFTISN